MKKNLILRILITFILLLSTYSIFAQKLSNVPKINITPMHSFLQKNADTTIVFSYTYGFVNPPKFFILSKKSDTITLYKYDSVFKNGLSKIPKKISDSLYKLNRPWESFDVGINRFFTSVNINPESALEFWSKISDEKPFNLKDDSTIGEGCPNTNAEYIKNIYDGGGVEIYLITKSNIKNLYYYAPEYYEKRICPGREDRKAILKIEELFLTYFDK